MASVPGAEGATKVSRTERPLLRTLVGEPRQVALWSLGRPAVGPSPILLLHGSAYSTRSVFDFPAVGGDDSYSLLWQLGQRGTTPFGLDFSGYSASRLPDRPAPEGINTYVDDAAAAAAFIREQTGLSPTVVGWSFGGQVAGRLAETHPGLVARLVLWGATWGHDREHVPPSMRTLAPLPDPWRTNTAEHAASDFCMPGTYDPDIVAPFVERALRFDPISPSAARSAIARPVALFDAEAIRAETLIVHGEHDPWVTEADIADLRRAIGQDRTGHEVVPRADHNAQFSLTRDVLAACLAEFARN